MNRPSDLPAAWWPVAAIDSLAPRLATLGHVMHAFGIDDGDVQALERPPQDGPAPRPVLHGATLLLPEAPPAWALPADELHLAATLHAIGHLRHSPRRQAAGKRKPMSLALAGAIEDVRVDRLLMRRHPGVGRLFRRLLRGQPELPQVGFEALVARLQRVLLDPQAEDHDKDGGDAWVRKGRALFEAQTARLDDAEAFRELVSVLANDLGQLRVRMNLQTYAPPLPWHDDNSHLWAHGANAEQAETPLRRPPPKGEPQPTPPQAPKDASDPAPLPELGRHDYPEWHYRLERARDNWCTVIERAVPPALASAPTPPARAPLRLARSRRIDRSQRIRRQWEGDELDLDAATEVFIDRRLGLAPDPRLFRRNGRAVPRTSLLLLLDLSASTADLQPCGRSVLDLEREAAALLMDALRDREDRLEVAGFDSDGRQAVNYLRLLDFGQPAPADPATVLGAARPGLSTRLGAALRHATARLAKETSAQRTLLVLSDGTPSDIDVFDARHLVEDAARAVVEARRKGVRCFCLSLDRASEADVRRIFGHAGYRIVDDPARLAAVLARSYAELAGG
ncbi:nitric oxide reductase activation protein NorD [Thauera humireducens]|uniref:nitric oxide reductase activation protein NorD n=1 Tax=Thauera humireducens TaxID=1134435 RepID=UPI0012E8E735|nr:VWA domain-containing protein [Thauera humireducens]